MASNLMGLAGLIAVAVAVGGLAGNWWWTVLVGGAFAFGLAVLAQADDTSAGRLAAAAASAPPAGRRA